MAAAKEGGMSQVVIKSRLDNQDASDLAATMESPGFRLIQDRLRLQRQQCVENLQNAPNWEEARHLQGQVAAIERSLDIPKILLAEVRKRNGEKKS